VSLVGVGMKSRLVQFLFILLIISLVSSLIFLIWWVLHREWVHFLFSFTGFLLLISFIIIRAASFYHMGCLLKSGPRNVHLNWILELGGIGLLLFASITKIRVKQRDFKLKRYNLIKYPIKYHKMRMTELFRHFVIFLALN